MTPEEALDRIREAGSTGAIELDLSGLAWDRLPQELGQSTSIQGLNLSRCEQLTDLSPLAGLASLQTLELYGCRLTDLSPLAGLTSLQTLGLSRNEQLTDFSPLAGLASLQTLELFFCGLTDLSPLAGLTSLHTLNLSGSKQLTDLSPLAGLTSLHTLNLSECEQLTDLSPLAGLTSLQTIEIREGQLSDLSPLAGLTSLQTIEIQGGPLSDLSPLADLTSLQTLNLSLSGQLSDLSPLATLTSLQTLDLSACTGVGKFAPLEELVSTLERIRLFDCRFGDLPIEICGQYQNVLGELRAHFEDLQSGRFYDAELKFFILGNGGVGKTQLSRRLRDLHYDPNVPTTHGIELNVLHIAVDPEGIQGTVCLNLWDFGGQDIYHGSHTLFLHSQAIFSILWNPEQQAAVSKQQLDSAQRPLAYWLDYLRAVAGTDSPVLIVQSQCDTPDKRAHSPVTPTEVFNSSWVVEISAKTGFGLDRLKGTLQDAIWACLHKRPPPPIGKNRVTVRNRLREMLTKDQQRPSAQRQHRLLERKEFDLLCAQVGGVSDTEALLKFLHHNGVLFYREDLFQGRIVLDQSWALEAIYSIFDRNKCLKHLKKLHGRFTREDLELLIWSGYTSPEQNVFLGMMESCCICFRVRRLPNGEWEYLAPELLPEWSNAQDLLLGRLRNDPPAAEASARYDFLHVGVLRGYLSKLGEHAKEAAIYWKYGCWFYEQTTHSQVLIESKWEDAQSEAGEGGIRFRAWGDNAEGLIEQLLEALRKLPGGQAPRIQQTKRISARGFISVTGLAVPRLVQRPLSEGGVSSPYGTGDKTDGLSQLQITAKPELPISGTPKIFVSHAWGDDSSEIARQRGGCRPALRDARQRRLEYCPGQRHYALRRSDLRFHETDRPGRSHYCRT
jgi:internalin A